ncbi:MAG: DUF6356 family protein [Pseudomonadota bacterium]
MKRLFTEHPESVGESYLEHMHSAFSFSATMAGCAVVCFLHGLLPFLFEKSATKTISKLHDRVIVNRHKSSQPSKNPRSARTPLPAE